MRLPYAYNANLAIKARSPGMWEGITRDIRVIHYTMVKPFTRDNKNYALVPMGELAANARRRGKSEFEGIFAEEMETWAQAWKETYAMYGEKPGGEDEDAWRGMEKGAAVQHPLRLLGGEGCGDEWLEAWSRPCR